VIVGRGSVYPVLGFDVGTLYIKTWRKRAANEGVRRSRIGSAASRVVESQVSDNPGAAI
jgi:hypothetical protein